MSKAAAELEAQASACSEGARLAAAAQHWLVTSAERAAAQAELHEGLARLASERVHALAAGSGGQLDAGGASDTDGLDQAPRNPSVSAACCTVVPSLRTAPRATSM